MSDCSAKLFPGIFAIKCYKNFDKNESMCLFFICIVKRKWCKTSGNIVKFVGSQIARDRMNRKMPQSIIFISQMDRERSQNSDKIWLQDSAQCSFWFSVDFLFMVV